MGRGTYLGGGTLVSTGAGISTKVGNERHSAAPKNLKRPKASTKKRLQKLEAASYLLEVIEAELAGGPVPNPARFMNTNRSLWTAIGQAGSATKWAHRQPDYANRRARLEKEILVARLHMPETAATRPAEAPSSLPDKLALEARLKKVGEKALRLGDELRRLETELRSLAAELAT